MSSKNVLRISKKIWGPKAWSLLHSFSIHPKKEITKEEAHGYYILYKTFVYMIPCTICKIHYKDMIEIYIPIVENEITRSNLKKWVWKIHNQVNKRLGKKQIEYKKAMKIQEKIENQDIFYFMNIVFMSFDEKRCCLFEYDQIYHFFYYFAKLYPDMEVREKLMKLVESDTYSNLSSPREFKEWYLKTYQQWQS